MRKEFMKAAKSMGTFLSAGLLALSLSFNAQAQEKLPLPSFPASFEAAEYQGQKGCVPNDPQYRFSVMENEGMINVGSHPMLSTPQVGAHIMVMMYNQDKDYGYMMSNKADGKLCVTQKINNVKFHDQLNLIKVHHSEALKPEDCTFAPQVLNLCGTFEQISGRLSNAGYSLDWQAENINGNTITMMSGTNQSWILTTNKDTGATIFTGAGKGEFSSLLKHS